ncbi:hypothetical protein B0H10DRAFT_2224040 [Mycena sp. CBHHK59/15]|nr:hypothetical protein B0H10DRAFT_2224040 [Mycena sp. CBHHK59/15]
MRFSTVLLFALPLASIMAGPVLPACSCSPRRFPRLQSFYRHRPPQPPQHPRRPDVNSSSAASTPQLNAAINHINRIVDSLVPVQSDGLLDGLLGGLLAGGGGLGLLLGGDGDILSGLLPGDPLGDLLGGTNGGGLLGGDLLGGLLNGLLGGILGRLLSVVKDLVGSLTDILPDAQKCACGQNQALRTGVASLIKASKDQLAPVRTH